MISKKNRNRIFNFHWFLKFSEQKIIKVAISDLKFHKDLIFTYVFDDNVFPCKVQFFKFLNKDLSYTYYYKLFLFEKVFFIVCSKFVFNNLLVFCVKNSIEFSFLYECSGELYKGIPINKLDDDKFYELFSE